LSDTTAIPNKMELAAFSKNGIWSWYWKKCYCYSKICYCLVTNITILQNHIT